VTAATEPYTVGVEEEFHLVDLATRELAPVADELLAGAEVVLPGATAGELFATMAELRTPVCADLDQVRAELTRLRTAVAQVAAELGAGLLASSTHPFAKADHEPLMPNERYRRMAATFRQLVTDQHIVGCHVHVGISDPEAVIQVMNRTRPLLPPLLALSANSPFWRGADTGYASWRSQVWRRWPASGVPRVFADRADFDRTVADLAELRVLPDATKLYWDVRPSVRWPTLEFRVTDVTMDIDDAVMLAGLVRACVRACHEAALRGGPFDEPNPEVLRAALWRAARDGLDGELIDVPGRRLAPAPEVVERFLAGLRPALEANGEWDEVAALVERTLAGGTGAARQLAALARHGRMDDVVDLALVRV
jgi:carboxylate-amine ligase